MKSFFQRAGVVLGLAWSMVFISPRGQPATPLAFNAPVPGIAPRVFITEILADNVIDLEDAEGDNEDWVELYNAGPSPVELAGWRLTDDAADLAKWVFPATNLAPHSYLVVFASGKNRAIGAGAELHTNFRLAAAGGYLALVRPDGTVASALGPSYPPQRRDVSFGMYREMSLLVRRGAATKWLIPTDDSLAMTWTGGQEPFNQTAWPEGPTGVGYVAVTSAAGSYSNLVLADPGLVAYWRLGESAGAPVNDFKGPHAGTLSGAFMRGAAGALLGDPDKATDFSGGRVTVPNAAALNFGGGALTVEAWVQPDVVNGFAWLVAKEADNTRLDYLLGLNPDGRFRFITQGLANDAVAPSAPAFDGQRWYHVVGVQDPVANRVSLYVNGALAVNVPRAASGVTSTGPLLIGDRSSGGQTINGRIDEVALYQRALSVADIVAHYQTGTNALGALAALVGTNVQSSMQGSNASVYLRIPFQVADVAAVDTLTLRLHYDDGFIAYLNGVEVVRRNAPASSVWNSSATAAREGIEVLQAEPFDLTPFVALLRPGQNVLAFHGLNASAGDNDFLLLPELEASLLPGEEYRYFAETTPGQPNARGYLGWVADTKFSVNRGFYDAPFDVVVSCSTPGATIRYTTNNSAPSATNGFFYAGPVRISRTTALRAMAFHPEFIPANVDTHTYLFTNDVLRQPANPAGFPTTWNGVAPDYGMDQAVVNMSQTYSVQEALRAIPTLAISASIDDVFGPNGVYANPVQQGELWERPVSAELIHPDGATAFQLDCGFQVQGAASRLPQFVPKHSFKLVFKRQYGATKLKHQVFPDSTLAKFDSLTLRAFYTDAWVANRLAPERFRPEDAQYQRDLWMKDTQLAMGHLASHNVYVHLYVCGLYWGLYNISERPDAFFNAEYRGGAKEEYDVLKDYQEVQNGDNIAFNTMFSIANRPVSDPRHIGTPAGYADLEQYLDIPALIDYMLLHIYAAAEDWPTHNWYAGRRRAPGAQFLFYVWDQEIGLDSLTRDRTTVNDNLTPAGLYAQLRAKSADFRLCFADHIQKHMFNGGALTPARNIERYLARAAQIDRAVVAESARWGDVQRRPAFNRDQDWLGVQRTVTSNFFGRIHPIVLQRFINVGLFPNLTAPTFNQPVGNVPAAFVLAMGHANPSGTIFFTLDGSDPRLSGGAIAPDAQAYDTPIPINAPTTVRARVKNGTVWSALAEATFYPPQDFTKLLLTELMYHPLAAGDISGDEFEFLELKNTGAHPLDLSGVTFDRGLSFTFTNGTSLVPGAFLVLVRNPVQFAARYPGVSVQGVFSGRLDNGGETLRLTHPLGATLFSFTYDDTAPWPVAPDGFGFSLVPLASSPGFPLDDGFRWRASTRSGGSPGADDPPPPFTPVVVSEVRPPSSGAAGFIELHNLGSQSVNIGGWFLSNEPNVPTQYRFPEDTLITGGGFHVVPEMDFNPTPGAANGLSISRAGGALYLLASDAATNLTGYSHGCKFGPAAEGETFGRLVISTGEEQFPTQTTPTPGVSNAGPRIGPLVISEIHYHPPLGDEEFIEIQNISSDVVLLYDPEHPTNAWRLDGLAYTFPPNLQLAPGAYVVLVASTPAVFRSKNGVPESVQVLGPWGGTLQDSGERLELQRPVFLDTNGLTYLTVDTVRYNDKAPWPPAADGSGPSLQRTAPATYGNDPIHWTAALPTPGSGLRPGQAPEIQSEPGSATVVAFQDISFDVIAGGTSPLYYQWKFNGQDVAGATNVSLLLTNVQLAQAGIYTVLVFNAFGSVLSSSAELVVRNPPKIIQPPRSTNVLAGTDITLSVIAIGSGPLSYQWRHNDTEIPGATNSTLFLSNAQPEASGSYRVIITDNVGPLISPPAIVNISVRAFILTHPLDLTVVSGQRATFAVSAGGTLPLSYRWRRGATDLTNYSALSTASTFTVSTVRSNLSLTNTYSVVVTNLGGGQASQVATLVVLADSDGDGAPDTWESLFGFNPGEPADGILDTDGDGVRNRDEFVAGTDPRDPTSYLRVERLEADQAIILQFLAVSNRSYSVQFKPTWDAAWSKLVDVPPWSSNRLERILDPNAGPLGRFYRLATPPVYGP